MARAESEAIPSRDPSLWTPRGFLLRSVSFWLEKQSSSYRAAGGGVCYQRQEKPAQPGRKAGGQAGRWGPRATASGPQMGRTTKRPSLGRIAALLGIAPLLLQRGANAPGPLRACSGDKALEAYTPDPGLVGGRVGLPPPDSLPARLHLPCAPSRAVRAAGAGRTRAQGAG